jgi:hypothetical protein
MEFILGLILFCKIVWARQKIPVSYMGAKGSIYGFFQEKSFNKKCRISE